MALGRHFSFSFSFSFLSLSPASFSFPLFPFSLFSFFPFLPLIFCFLFISKREQKKEKGKRKRLYFICVLVFLWGFRDSSLHALPVTSLWVPLASYYMFTCDLFCYPRCLLGALNTFTIFLKLWWKLLVWIYNDKKINGAHYFTTHSLIPYASGYFVTPKVVSNTLNWWRVGVWGRWNFNFTWFWLYKQFILYHRSDLLRAYPTEAAHQDLK